MFLFIKIISNIKCYLNSNYHTKFKNLFELLELLLYLKKINTSNSLSTRIIYLAE